MAVSIIYRVSHTLPEALTAWLAQNDERNRGFESAIIAAYSGHVGSGANTYSDREEWAEFTDQAMAKRANEKARRVITDFNMRRITEGGES